MRTVHVPSLIPNREIQGLSYFLVAESPSSLGALITGVSDEGRDIKGRFCVAGIAHLGVSSAVVDDDDVAIKVHKIFILLESMSKNKVTFKVILASEIDQPFKVISVPD